MLNANFKFPSYSESVFEKTYNTSVSVFAFGVGSASLSSSSSSLTEFEIESARAESGFAHGDTTRCRCRASRYCKATHPNCNYDFRSNGLPGCLVPSSPLFDYSNHSGNQCCIQLHSMFISQNRVLQTHFSRSLTIALSWSLIVVQEGSILTTASAKISNQRIYHQKRG